MLTIWTKCATSKTLKHLSSVFRAVPDLPVTVVHREKVNTGKVFPSGHYLAGKPEFYEKPYEVSAQTKVLLALGSDTLKQLQDEGLIAKNRTVTSYRTIPIMRQGIPVLVSYNPDIGEIDHGYFVDLLTDVSLGIRYCLTGSWAPVFGHYKYVTDFSELCAAIEAEHTQTQDIVSISLDLETRGLDPFKLPTINPPMPGGYIVSIQATHIKGAAHVIRFCNQLHEEQRLADPVLREQIDFLLHCPYIRLKGADFKYDLGWLAKRGKFMCSTFTFDTTLVGSLLDENRSNSLDVHVKVYCPTMGGYSDVFDRTVDKNRMDQVPPEQLLPYAGGDVDGDLQVAEVEKKELLKDPKLTSFYVNILHPAGRAFEQIQQGGMLVDLNAYQELKSDLEKEHTRLVTEVRKIIGGRIVAKHMDLSRPGGMNLTKPAMLCDFMFSRMGLNLTPKMFTEKPDKDGVKKPSTAMEHLLMFEDVPEAKPFVMLVKEDSQIMKTYETYVIGFLEHVRSDGRFHPNYFLFVGNRQEGDGGAKTGRLSCKAPAFQTIPKHTVWAVRIRRCFPAPPGYVVVERDYQQGELRVIACIAHEDTMIAEYKAGRDLHVSTAAPFAGYTYESLLALEQVDLHLYEETRQLGKAGNFGLVFGMGPDGFIVYARSNYGVTLEDQEGKDFHAAFFARYNKLPIYHKEYIRLAHRDKQVRGPLGRLRHLPLIDSPNRELQAKAERQAINSPVQGTLTDMVLWSAALEHQEGLQSIAPTYGACHDSLYNYCPEDQVEKVVNRQLEIMENLPFHIVGWKPQLKFIADAKVGPNMGEMKKFKRS